MGTGDTKHEGERMATNVFVSLDVLAIDLGLPRPYLKRLAEQGRIPSLAVSRWRRFAEEQVRAALCRLAETTAAELQIKSVKENA